MEILHWIMYGFIAGRFQKFVYYLVWEVDNRSAWPWDSFLAWLVPNLGLHSDTGFIASVWVLFAGFIYQVETQDTWYGA
jgi:hypothetical protein